MGERRPNPRAAKLREERAGYSRKDVITIGDTYDTRAADEYGTVPTSDRPEMAENREHTVAMKLMRKLLEDFREAESFTFQDVQESYNDQAHIKDAGKKQSETTLKFLVEQGFLTALDNDEYRIDESSEKVAQLLE